MNGSIHQHFKVGTLLWMSYPGRDTLTSLKKLVCDDYFDAVEISHIEDPAVRAQAAKLKEEGFFREEDPLILSFEVTPFGDEDPDAVLANCKRALNRAWAAL